MIQKCQENKTTADYNSTNTSLLLNVQWVNSPADIPEELWHKCFPPPLEGRWWYSVLENSELDDQFKFFYGILSKDSQAIGIVPTFLMNVPMEIIAPDFLIPLLPLLSKVTPAFAHQRTLFVGSPCAEEGTVGLIPGLTLKDIVQPLHKILFEQSQILNAEMLVWKDFPQSCEPALDLLCQTKDAFKIISYPGTMVQFPEASLNSYYSGLKSSHRHNLRKKIKRGEQILPLNLSAIQRPNEQTLEEIFALFYQTYERGKTKFERLNKKFFSLIAEQNESWFVMLREPANNKLVAFMLCFLVGNRIINKFIGIDYALASAKESYLYFRLWHAAVQWATSLGIKEIQSGQTGYRFKLDVGNTLVPLFNYSRHKNPIINWVYAKIAQSISWSNLDEDLRLYLKAHPNSDFLAK